MILEKCCYRQYISTLLESKYDSYHLFTNGDVDLQVIMDQLVSHSPECDVYLVLVNVHLNTIRTIARLMEAKIPDTGQYLVRSFTILSQGDDRKSISQHLSQYRKEGRLKVFESNIAFRCLCVGNENNSFVLQGSIPQENNYSMQMMTFTKSKKLYDNVMSILHGKKN